MSFQDRLLPIHPSEVARLLSEQPLHDRLGGAAIDLVGATPLSVVACSVVEADGRTAHHVALGMAVAEVDIAGDLGVASIEESAPPAGLEPTTRCLECSPGARTAEHGNAKRAAQTAYPQFASCR